jgi:hypothetical protein
MDISNKGGVKFIFWTVIYKHMVNKIRVAFAPKEDYYNNYITFLKGEYKKDNDECPRYPARETFDDDTREELKTENPDRVIEGLEKIDGETVPVWYFYDKS